MQATSKKKGLNWFKPELNCMRTKSWFGLVQEMVWSQFSSEGSFSEPVLFLVHKKMLQNQTKLNHGITTTYMDIVTINRHHMFMRTKDLRYPAIDCVFLKKAHTTMINGS